MFLFTSEIRKLPARIITGQWGDRLCHKDQFESGATLVVSMSQLGHQAVPAAPPFL